MRWEQEASFLPEHPRASWQKENDADIDLLAWPQARHSPFVATLPLDVRPTDSFFLTQARADASLLHSAQEADAKNISSCSVFSLRVSQHLTLLDPGSLEACSGASDANASICGNAWLIFDLEEKFTVTRMRRLASFMAVVGCHSPP